MVNGVTGVDGRKTRLVVKPLDHQLIPSCSGAQAGRKACAGNFTFMCMLLLRGSGQRESRCGQLHLHVLAPGRPLMEHIAPWGMLTWALPPPWQLLLGLAVLMEAVGLAQDLPAPAGVLVFGLGTGEQVEDGPHSRLGLGTLLA